MISDDIRAIANTLDLYADTGATKEQVEHLAAYTYSVCEAAEKWEARARPKRKTYACACRAKANA